MAKMLYNTPEQKAKLDAYAAIVQRRYMRTFVRDVIGFTNEPFHDEIDNILSDEFYRKIVISLPRNHGKSSHLSVAYPLWEIARDHNVRILLISATAAISEGFMQEILGHIERNEAYQEFSQRIDKEHLGVVPRTKPGQKSKQKWSGNKFIVDRSDLKRKDPTMNAVGIFGGIVSKRADIIICDDIVNQENAMTDSQRRKVIDWIYTTVMPCLVPGGRFIYLGNTWHNEDLVAHLMKDPQFDYQNTMGAIIHEADRQDLWTQYADILLRMDMTAREKKGQADLFYQNHKIEMDAGTEVLWPSKFPYKDLFMLRLANSYAFARMYQCNPSDRPDQVFKEEWIERALNKGSKLRLTNDDMPEIEFDLVTEGIDLAIKEDEGGDDNAKITLARVRYGNGDVKTGDIVVKQIFRGHIAPASFRKRIVQDYYSQKPQPVQIRVESNGYQDAIRQELKGEEGGLGLPIIGHQTGREKNDSEIGVNSLAILAEQGKLVLPYDITDSHTIQEISKLVSGMRSYPSDHTDDALMAMWLANMAMRQMSADRYLVPSTTFQALNKDPKIDLHDPSARKLEENKADIATAKVNELYRMEERQKYNEMMRNAFKRGR